MLAFLARRWFLLALVAVLTVGFGFSESLSEPVERAPRHGLVAAVLFVMALPLDIGAMWRAFSRPGPVLLAVAVNFGLVPPLAWLVHQTGLLAADLSTGLLIMSAIPCTMASAAVWTRRAGGNDAVAILVTMLTNLGCFLITPMWILLLTNQRAELSPRDLILRLLLLVVVPIMLAQLLRLWQPLALWSTARKRALSNLAQCGILSMVMIGAVGASQRLSTTDQQSSIGWVGWVLMGAAVLAVHLVALVSGMYLARLCGMRRPERIAVAFAGSQKTLMVGLDLGLQYFGGLTILPMVAYHVGQLLVDTFIADRMQSEAGDDQQS